MSMTNKPNLSNVNRCEKSDHFLFKDITGEKFGHLLVTGYYGRQNYIHFWECLCDCGNTEVIIVRRGNLSGNTTSCGCYEIKIRSEVHYIHGLYNTSEHRSYHTARQRCENPNNSKFYSYGNRGIKFLLPSLEEFIKVVGMKPEPKENFSIERLDNNGHYEIGNVKWANRYEQGRNKRNNNLLIYNGETKCVSEWSSIVNISDKTIYSRLDRGWCDECTLSISARNGKCTHIFKL